MPYWRAPARILPPAAAVSCADGRAGIAHLANCKTTILEPDAEAAGWRFYSDGVGELLPFCEVCSAREFAPDAPASTDA